MILSEYGITCRLTVYSEFCQDSLPPLMPMTKDRDEPRARRRFAMLLGACALALLPAACGGEEGPSAQPVFPENPELAWREIRDCRHSHEHELRFIRVFASPTAEDSYLALSPDVPYPVGATLVKLEYDDPGYTELLGYTALQKQEPGVQPAGGDWLWQRVNADREVEEEGAMLRCVNCHAVHCEPPHGYDLTCAEEI